MVLNSVLSVKILPDFTLSRAYRDTCNFWSAFNLGNVDATVYEGAAFLQRRGFLINLIIPQSGDSNLENDDLDYELSFSYTGIEN